MNPFRADLHCHSTCSDGSATPEELVHLAKESGLSGLSITDHDTIEAFAIAAPLAKEAGIALIPGVEFSSTLNGANIHVLGYAFDTNNARIIDLCKRHEVRRKTRNLAILDALQNVGIRISYDDIADTAGTIGRPHIANAMIKAGYARTIDEVFQLYLGDNKPCYVKSSMTTTEETIAIIHEGGGLAVIAHPHLIRDRACLDKLTNLPFDGIECYYARMAPSFERPWVRLAKKKGWLATGGSDFHGTVKPNIPLGASWVGPETFHTLYDHYKHHVS